MNPGLPVALVKCLYLLVCLPAKKENMAVEETFQEPLTQVSWGNILILHFRLCTLFIHIMHVLLVYTLYCLNSSPLDFGFTLHFFPLLFYRFLSSSVDSQSMWRHWWKLKNCTVLSLASHHYGIRPAPPGGTKPPASLRRSLLSQQATPSQACKVKWVKHIRYHFCWAHSHLMTLLPQILWFSHGGADQKLSWLIHVERTKKPKMSIFNLNHLVVSLIIVNNWASEGRHGREKSEKPGYNRLCDTNGTEHMQNIFHRKWIIRFYLVIFVRELFLSHWLIIQRRMITHTSNRCNASMFHMMHPWVQMIHSNDSLRCSVTLIYFGHQNCISIFQSDILLTWL